MMHPTTKLARNQFKCFQCRKVFAQRDGDWINWNQMQVHLCRGCDKLTTERPEREADAV
ncbi:MAG TPA: hypothetical protein VM598_04435 [Bdellovibrionota bacterium]|jgi:hypothetical protein|nr:hypothetical protein [Bdellovibrionota bacterium]